MRSHNEFNGDDENFAHSKTTKNLKNFTSPFKIPTDEEVFQYCEIERQKKEDRKKGITIIENIYNNYLPIWLYIFLKQLFSLDIQE